MTQDLHMLKEKNKNKCIYSSMLSPFTKVDDEFSFKPKIFNNKNLPSNTLKSATTPLIKGKECSYSEAIKEIKKIIKFEKSMHIDGLSTDFQSIQKILDFAEKYKSSINHMCADELNVYFSAMQKYGGSFVSFNELKKRADFIIVIGAKEENFSSDFFNDLNWKKTKIKRTIFYIDDKKKNTNYFSLNLIDQINYLKSFLTEKEFGTDQKFKDLKQKFSKSVFPIVIANIKKKDYALTYSIFDFVRILNKQKRIKMYSIYGSNNSGGFINACVTKTGYPNAINFTEIGPVYEPNFILPDKQKEQKNLQVFVSSFEPNPNFVFFKKNIFVGHPDFVYKKKVDVFIPTKTPGYDARGLIVRSDNGGIFKLEKIVDSDFPLITQLFEDIQKK